jgi:hypothetical protein
MGVLRGWITKNISSLGEISPKLYHRTDLENYSNGLKTARNVICNVEGTITNAPQYVLDKSLVVAGLPTDGVIKAFKYNVIEQQDAYDGVVVLFAVGKTYILKLINTSPITITVEKEIASTYISAEIKQLSVSQIENNVLVCTTGKEPSMIRIEEDTLSASGEIDYWNNIINPPVKPVDTDYIVGFTGYEDSMTWQTIANYIEFKTIKLNMLEPAFASILVKGNIRIYGGTYRIDSVVLASGYYTFKTTRIVEGTLEAPATVENLNSKDVRFSEDLFSGGRYPSIGGVYQSRLFFADVEGNTNVIVFSKTLEYFDFSTGLNDDDGIVIFVPAPQHETIRKVVTYNSILIMTDNAIWSSSINTILTPKTSQLFQQIGMPPSNGLFVTFEGTIYYVNSFGNKIYRIDYDLDSQNYVAHEISLFARHLFDRGIQDIGVIQYQGYDYIASNTIISVESIDEFGESTFADVETTNLCNNNIEQGVIAWSRYEMPNKFERAEFLEETLFFNISTNLEVWKLSDTVFRDDMVIELLPPTMSDLPLKANDLPFITKQFDIKQIYLSIIGDYDVLINGNEVFLGFGQNPLLPSNVRALRVLASNQRPIKITNKNNERTEILSIYYELESNTES